MSITGTHSFREIDSEKLFNEESQAEEVLEQLEIQ
jgi:hypothetical protein